MDWFLYDNGLRHERVKCVMEFSRRFDLANGKYLSNFLGVFARIVKVTHERVHVKIHPCKADKNNIESMFFPFEVTCT